MMKFPFAQICSDLLKVLPEKQREILSRRFALSGKEGVERETLESIGKTFGITRERVRQIEEDGFSKLKPEIRKYQKVFQYFNGYIKKSGGLKKEDLLLEDLGGRNLKNQIYFLLTLGGEFLRYGETGDFYSFWSVSQDSAAKAKKITASFYEKLKKIGRPLLLKDFNRFFPSNEKVLASCTESPKGTRGEKRFISSNLEIFKKIQKNSENLFGLREWPEINPRGVKDKAYLTFKKEKKPLHFKEVASLIPNALAQTVHNELIKDPRFVLIGRGIYALKEWGYEEGFVKDIISKTLKEAGKPLSKSEVLEKVLKQRLVKENTVLLNLGNKKYFSKIPGNFYTIREA